MLHDFDVDVLNGLAFEVECFDDEFAKIFSTPADPPSFISRVANATCPHCGKDIFFSSTESGVFELVKNYSPDLDGSDSICFTDVVNHKCDESDLFEEEIPF